MARDLSGNIAEQTSDALDLVGERLAEAGSDRRWILTAHIWLRDMVMFREMTSVWNDWVDDDYLPSRSCVAAGPAHPRALLEVVVTAVVPKPAQDPNSIERYNVIHAPGRPSMCIGLAYQDWVTVCMIAPDCTQDVAGQTQQILDAFDGYLASAGADRTRLLTAEIWLKHIDDMTVVRPLWSAWVGFDHLPAGSYVRADMARPEMLIEIRITASRPA
jgi:enamine deaminase RidA (YjgF/YER057c/UK114 family)